MIIIAEKINSSRKAIAKAIEEKYAALIQNEAKIQADAGADYIDVNAGSFLGQETDYLKWLVETVQEVVDIHPYAWIHQTRQLLTRLIHFAG